MMRRLLFALSAGYITFFFSERVFWSFWRLGEDVISDSIITWLFYSLCVYVMLWLIHAFRVHDIYGLFLAGAILGWIMEGIIAMTTFGQGGMPIFVTASFTALSWHALLTTLIVWYWFRKVLEEGGLARVLKWSIAIGAFWGLWSLAWELETPPVLASPGNFFVHGFVTTALFVVAHMIWTRIGPFSFVPGRIEKGFLLVFFGGWFVLITFPTVGLLSLSLPALLYIAYKGLQWNKARTESHERDILETLGHPIRWHYYIAAFAMPAVATLIFTGAKSMGISLPANLVVLFITTPLGYWYLIKSLRVIHKRPLPAASSQAAEAIRTL